MISTLTPQAIADLNISDVPLVVRVANEQKWILSHSVWLTLWLDGMPVTGVFWITDQMADDVLLGLNTLRDLKAGIKARHADEGGGLSKPQFSKSSIV